VILFFPLFSLCTLGGVHGDVYRGFTVGWWFLSVEKCYWVTGIISRYLMGKPVRFDVSQFVAAVVERCEGGFRCRLCGYVGRVNMLVYHLRRRHCGELLELWGKLRPRALFRGGGGRASYMPFRFYCRVCGWSIKIELPCNSGPPDVKRKLGELVGVVIPRCCPGCGRVFDVSRLEFGFAGLKDSFKRG
jgi:rubredoxin